MAKKKPAKKLATMKTTLPEPKIIVGVKKDLEDSRDYIYEPLAKAGGLPSKYDLIDYCAEIENQKTTGSCVANAAVSALETLSLVKGISVDLSRLFVYWNIREPYPELKGKDDGAYLRDGFKSINQIGVCPEPTWPFIVSKVNDEPSQTAFYEAPYNKVLTYARIYTNEPDKIKTAITEGHPVIFSTGLGNQFYEITQLLEDQRYKAINTTDNPLVGYHAMSIVGYDDSLNGGTGAFIVENSWSDSWGDQGFAIFPYEVFESDAYDAWVTTSFQTSTPPPQPTPPREKTFIEKIIGIDCDITANEESNFFKKALHVILC